MTPPEPEPDPPTPTIYTYSSAESFTLEGNVPAMYYTAIKSGDTNCVQPVKNESASSTRNLTDLVVYSVGADTYYYFANGSKTSFYGLLANNSNVGETNPVYQVVNGAASVSYNALVKNPTPSDYFSTIKSGDFTLMQRS